MKVLIPILIGLLVVGCGKGKQPPAAKEPVKEPTLAEKIVGAYELDGKIVVFHNSGKMESYYDGKKEGGEYKWKIVDKEVHAVTKDGGGSAWGINPDGSLISLAVIQSNGNRLYLPRLPKIGNTDYQPYWKKTLSPEAAAAALAKKQSEIVEAAIREELEKPIGKLTKMDLEKVTVLRLRNKNLTDLKGLEKLTRLTVLSLTGNQLTSVKGLEKLTQFKELYLSKNQLTDVMDLEKLTKLQKLGLRGNRLTDVKGLEKLTQLRRLSLHGNQLTSVKGLEKLTQLEELWLGGNQLTDVKGLEKLDQLKTLEVSKNKLTDLKGLEKLTQLTSLNLFDKPDLTKAQIAELQKALPNCEITHNAK